MMKYLVRLAMTASFPFLISCTESKTKTEYFSGAGMVENITVLEERGMMGPNDPGLIVRAKIWYRDSFAIEESVSVKTNISAQNNVKHEFIIDNYRFNDLRRKTIWLYRNFSDTAAFYDRYEFKDSVTVAGGWGFNHERKPWDCQQIGAVTDTVIDKVAYKQMRLKQKERGDTVYQLVFFRCDKAINPFNFQPALSKKMGRPLTIAYYSDSSFTHYFSKIEIKFVSDSLTQAQHKVFDAWIRNSNSAPATTGRSN